MKTLQTNGLTDGRLTNCNQKRPLTVSVCISETKMEIRIVFPLITVAVVGLWGLLIHFKQL